MRTSTSDLSSPTTMAAQPIADINVDDMTLRLLSQNLGDSWERLATFLGISSDTVDILKKDNRKTDEQIFQMLKKWKCGFDEVDEDRMKIELTNCLIQHERRDLASKFQEGTLVPREELLPARRENVECLTDGVLRKLSGGLGGGWQHLATQLGTSSAQVGNIKRDYYGTEEQIFQMLIKWREGNSTDRPVDVMKKALKQIGRTDLAVKLMAIIENYQH